MHISCPHCNASYEVGPMIKNAVLVCHRCHAEFGMDDELIEQQKKSPQEEVDQPLPLFDQIRPDHATEQDEQKHDSGTSGLSSETSPEEANALPLPAFLGGDHAYAKKTAHEETPAEAGIADDIEDLPGSEKTDQSSDPDTENVQISLQEIKESDKGEVFEPIAPARKLVVIWPWLIAMLLIISGAGFWFKQDVWLDHPWVRSMLINMRLPIEVRNKDWSVIPGSVQGQWLKRDDGSQVLTIQGRIENRLYCELPPPRILIRFFDDTGITESLGEKLLPVTEPPSMEQVKHAPFVTPDIDHVPVEAQGERGFFLVVDSLPERTADFTLSPEVHRKQ